MLISCVFIGWGKVVELVTNKPIINLKVLEVDSVGADATNPRPQSGNTSEENDDVAVDFYKPDVSDQDEVNMIYDVRIRGKKIYFDDQLCSDAADLKKKMNARSLDKSKKVHLVDDYADSVVYKDIRDMLNDLCQYDESTSD